jgi:hypothetical protein
MRVSSVASIAARRDDQQRGHRQAAGHPLQHAPGRFVEPLHVVDVQDGALELLGQSDQERRDRGDELLVPVELADLGRLHQVGQQR